MIADTISHGHGWGADLCFLFAVILAGLAALAVAVDQRPRRPADGTVLREYVWAPVLGWAALALVGLGLLIL